ncbi:MAG: nucleotidyltransferase family protein, partial [Candidatus Methanomethylicia archaeon]
KLNKFKYLLYLIYVKAVILAGGQGKRLRPITETIPKPLIRIHSKPIIAYQMEWLKKFGVEEFIICVSHLKEKFIEEIGSGRSFMVKVAYVVEDEPLGTGGGLKNAEYLLKGEEFFYVVNGDVITNLNPIELLKVFDSSTVGVIALIPLPSPYGIVKVNNGNFVKSFSEKPQILDYWINAGVYVFKPDIFNYLPNKGDIEKTAFPQLARENKLKAVKYHEVIWKSIDTHKDIEEVEKIISTGLICS